MTCNFSSGNNITLGNNINNTIINKFEFILLQTNKSFLRQLSRTEQKEVNVQTFLFLLSSSRNDDIHPIYRTDIFPPQRRLFPTERKYLHHYITRKKCFEDNHLY
jgi:hypothetical protein